MTATLPTRQQSRQIADTVYQDRKSGSWPYTWVYPPPAAEDVNVEGTIVAPANNTLTQILSYQVPSGQSFCFTGVILQAMTGGAIINGWTPGDGNVLFTIDQDTPIGVVNTTGSPLRGWSNVTTPRGSVLTGRIWDIRMPFIIPARTVLRAKVITQNPVAVGSGNEIIAVFLGYTYG
jgi:hypothetical protein